MKSVAVKVPGVMLLDRHLAGSAKLLWMILQLSATNDRDSISTGLLKARSGFDRHTVLRGLAQLESTGWLPVLTVGCHTAPQGWASVPRDLLLDNRAGIQARLLYGILQLTPEFRGSMGQFTYSELSGLTGMSPNTVKQAVIALQETGWL